MAKVLAFDLGASSGRAILGFCQNGKLSIEEVHRFVNEPVTENGTLYWNFDFLLSQIKEGIKKAAPLGFDSIGIDTWGVDFGLLDKEGHLLSKPVHYRDARTEGVIEEVDSIIPSEELYLRNGIQHQRLNTLYQLYAMTKKNSALLSAADKLLLTPDLIAYHLTGEMHCEYTIASTTQLLTPDGEWDKELAAKLSIPTEIFAEIIQPGAVYGTLTAALAKELGCKAVPVIAVASHDTASAVAAVPTEKQGAFYISSGTWSLMGTESPHPVINRQTAAYNLTNEGGYGGTIRLLKNIMGLWLLQESRRQWQREGKDYSFARMEEMAGENAVFESFINVDAPELYGPGDIPSHVIELCRRSGVNIPKNDGEVVRCIYNSLAAKYAATLKEVEEVTGRKADVLHIVGGGSKDDTLCALAAKRCGVPVVAGPTEATALGNIAVQMIASGDFKNIIEARHVITASFPLKTFEANTKT